MRVRPLLLALGLTLLAVAPVACGKSGGGGESAEGLPPAPHFEGWAVKTDVVEPHARFAEIEGRLGGHIKALRNVVYGVDGKTVQVNIIVAEGAPEGEKIYKKLTSLKPAWACARKGEAIYEFVGENDVEAEIRPDPRVAHAHAHSALASRLSRGVEERLERARVRATRVRLGARGLGREA
jgi:hypothetical protein